MGKSVRIDDAGELRCWNCGSKGLETRRRTGSKLLGATAGVAIMGPLGAVGALAAKKRLRCQGCGEYNDVGRPKPFTSVGHTATKARPPQSSGGTGSSRAKPAQQGPKNAKGKLKAGWYLDPKGAPRTLRFWSGNNWTDHTCPDPDA